MILLVDAGNTRIKWAWFSDGLLTASGDVCHRGMSPKEAIQKIGRPACPAQGVRLASVAGPELTEALRVELARVFGSEVSLARTERAAEGVRNGYLDCRQLGVDRWLAMVAAYARFRAAVCVVDAGTAWTVDAIEADGRHLGGMIIPGPALMRRSLLEATAGIAPAAELLPAAASETPGWGRDTETCIVNGAVRAATCLVESCVTAFPAAGSPPPILVITGGDAPVLLGALSGSVEHRPLLVLEGLALIEGAARPGQT